MNGKHILMASGRAGIPSHVYAVRVGPLVPLPDVLRALGHDPVPLFAAAGVDIHVLDNPDNRIAFDSLGRLFETCGDTTGCDHLGLLVGQRFTLDALGELGTLMRNSPTVGVACRRLTLHMHLQDRGAVPLLIHVSDRHVALGYSVLRYETPGTRQLHEGVVTSMCRLMRELCGPAWQPIEIQWSHSRPGNLAPYRKALGSRLHFDADFSAAVFDSKWLEHPLQAADPDVFEQVSHALTQMEDSRTRSLADKVRRALQSMVFSGTASSEGIAHLFQLHERTLRRRLADEGTSAHALIQEVLFSVSRQLLRETRLNVADIAAVLHYGNTPAFSTAFRRWAQHSPRQWRQRVQST